MKVKTVYKMFRIKNDGWDAESIIIENELPSNVKDAIDKGFKLENVKSMLV